MTNKTHWLKNPNKNYLGHWDLPNNDLILTIKSAGWEDVKDPTRNTTELKRVVHFDGNIKPLICNETNAQAIYKSTGIRYLEDSNGARIALFIGEAHDRKNKITVEAVRVRPIPVLPPKTVDDFPEQKAMLLKCKTQNELQDAFLSLDRIKRTVFNGMKDELKKVLK